MSEENQNQQQFIEEGQEAAGQEEADDDYSADFHQTAQAEQIMQAAQRPEISSQMQRQTEAHQQDQITSLDQKSKTGYNKVLGSQLGEDSNSCNTNKQKSNFQSINSEHLKQQAINFNSAVMVSSENMSFQQRSDKADTVAHTIGENEQAGIPESRTGSRAHVASSEGTAGGVFSQKSSASMKLFGGQAPRPPIHSMTNQSSMLGGDAGFQKAGNQCDTGIFQTSGKVQINKLLQNKGGSALSQAQLQTRKRSTSREPVINQNQQYSNEVEDNISRTNDYQPSAQQRPPRASVGSTIPQSPRRASKDAQGTLASKLLRGFKLQQYAQAMTENGYGQDIFKLAFLSQRERQELMVQLEVQPAHKARMSNMFKIIEQLNPKQGLHKALQKAQKQSAKPGERPQSTTGMRARRQGSSSQNRIKIRKKSPEVTIESRPSDANDPSTEKCVEIQGEITPGGNQRFDGEQTQQYLASLQDGGACTSKNTIMTAGRIRSQSKGNTDSSQTYLSAYNQLEPIARLALNEQFLTNVKSGRNHQSFHQALQAFQEKSQERNKARNAINQIFPEGKFVKQKAQVANIYLKNQALIQNNRPSTESTTKSQKPPVNQASAQKSQRKRPMGQSGLPLAQGPNRTGSKNRAIYGQASLRSQGHLRSSSQSRGIAIESGYEHYETPDKNSGNLSIFTQNKLQQRGHSRHRSSSQQKHPSTTKAGSQRGIPTMIPLPGSEKPHSNIFNQNSSSKRSREGSNIGRGIDSAFFNKRRNSSKGLRPLPTGAGTSATDGLNDDSQTMNTSLFNASKEQTRFISNPDDQDMSIQTSVENMQNQQRSTLPSLVSPTEGQMVSMSEAGQDGVYRKSELQINNKNISIGDEQNPIFKSEARRGGDLRQSQEDLRKSRASFASKHPSEEPDHRRPVERPGSRRTSARPQSRNSARGPSFATPTEIPNTNLEATKVTNNDIPDLNIEQQMYQTQSKTGSQTPIVEGSGKFSGVASPEKQKNLQSLEPNHPPFQLGMESIPQDFQEAINDFGSPLLSKEDQKAAFLMGQSLNSKKVAQGPTFFNLRIMCHCLGRAMRRHCDFSQDTLWFLDEVQALKKESDPFLATGADELDFSYKFQDDLKIPTTEKKEERKAQAKAAEENFYEGDDFEPTPAGTAQDLDKLQINEFSGQNKVANPTMKTDPSIDGDDPVIGKQDMDNLEEREGDNIDEVDIQLEVKEQRQIEQVRREEMFKQSMNSQKGGQSNTFLQMQLHEKDKKIQELTKMVQMFENTGKDGKARPSAVMSEILAISGEAGQMENEYDLDDFDSENKMTRQEFLVAQLDLDPIQSQYSQEQQQQSSHHPNADASRNAPGNTKGTFQKQSQLVSADRQINQTMGNASLNSVSQGVSLRSSQNGLNASGSLGASGVFKSPRSAMMGKKPPIMSKSQQKFFPGGAPQVEKKISSDEQAKIDAEKAAKKEKEKFDRMQQISILREQLTYFDERYDFETGVLNEDKDLLAPSEDDIAAYSKYVTIASKMENETPVIALVYIERLLQKAGILINKYNWKRFLLVCLCVASKVWDDDSLENQHFPKVMSDVTAKMINQLEQTLLDVFLQYDLVVKGSEYAKYYFIMRTLADGLRDESQIPDEQNPRRRKRKRDEWAEFPLKAPITVDQMANLQRNAAKAEIYLKERYELDVIEAIGKKFQGKEQKDRLRKFDSTI